MTGAAVGFFGIYQGIEFIKSSVDEFNQAEHAISQIKAGLISTKGVAGITFEELTAQALKFNEAVTFEDDMLADMQAQLLSFHNINKPVFEGVETAIMDIAARTGGGLHEVSIAVGKAFNDPESGLSALRRYGVQFDAKAEKEIKHYIKAGNLLKAHQLMLEAINVDYKGSAEALAQTDEGKLKMLEKGFKDVKQEIGKLVMEETVKLAPTIKELIKDTQKFVHWLSENREQIIKTGKVVGEVVIALWAMNRASAAISASVTAWNTLKGVVAATKVLMAETAVAQAAIGTTAVASTGATVVAGEVAAGAAVAGGAVAGGETAAVAGGIGLSGIASVIVPVLGAAVTVLAVRKLAEATGLINKVDTDDAEEYAKWMEEQRQKAEEDRKFARDSDPIKAARDDEAMKNFDFSKIQTSSPIGQAIAADVAGTKKILELSKKNEKPEPKKQVTKSGVDKTLSDMQSNVTGQNIKNYHVTINGGLIHDFTVKTQTTREAVPDIKRVVTEAMTDSVNDFQLNGR